MSDDEDVEYRYRVSERLGILCGADEPTLEQLRIARREAEKACQEIFGG